MTDTEPPDRQSEAMESSRNLSLVSRILYYLVTGARQAGKGLFYLFVVVSSLVLTFSILYWWLKQEGVFPLEEPSAVSWVPVPEILLPLSGAIGFLFLVLFLGLRHRISRMGEMEESLQKSRKKLSERNRELRSSIEFLTAAREVALILNESVDFEKILSKVLRITSQLIGTDHAREIAIFMPETEGGDPVPRACWKNGEMMFEQEAARNLKKSNYVEKAYRYGQELTLAGDDSFQFILPLIADREKTGVLRIKMDLRGEKEQMREVYSRLSSNLSEFSKILALAIKTPDLYTRTITDSLTGLYAKQHLLNQLETHLSMANRHRESLSLIFVDLDHFKEINDTHGHQTGDRVLKRLGRFLRENTRGYTTAYRYGGEEMVLLAPRTNREKAYQLAERLRSGIEELNIESTDGTTLDVTASFGIATKDPSMDLKAEDLLERADEALYRSKEDGRNQVSAAG